MWPFISILIFVVLLVLLVLTFLFKGYTSTAKLYMVYHEDGLWDLYLGLILLVLGLAEWFETPLIGIIPAILYPILLAAKQAITAPRLRPEDLPTAQGARRRTTVFIVIGLTLLFILLTTVLLTVNPSPWIRAWLDRYLVTTLWLLVIVLFAIWGYTSGATRLFGYAALFLLVFAATVWFDLPLYLYMLGLGALICVSGLAVMVRFVQAHPTLAPR